MEMTKSLYNFKVTWQPFFLRPNMPAEGIPKPEGYGPHTAGSQRLINIGKQVGIDFSYKSDRFPNTLLCHCALEYALEKDPSGKIQNDLQEKLFKCYFTDGRYPDAEVVSGLAGESGLDSGEVKSYISDAQNQAKVQKKAMEQSANGVSGVPYFIVNGQGMVSGAQEPDTFVKMFAIANEKFPLEPIGSESSQSRSFK